MKSARIYYCACCRIQVIICSRCDRGNIYCGPPCSRQSRIQNHRISNQKYQRSAKGRQKNAERQRRYRERRKKVTDHTSKVSPPDDLLTGERRRRNNLSETDLICDFCGQPVLLPLRRGYLRDSNPNDTSSFLSGCWPRGP